MDPATIAAGLPLLVQALGYILNRAPGIFPIVRDFWGANDLGPMPPDLDAWRRVDDEIDARLAEGRPRVSYHHVALVLLTLAIAAGWLPPRPPWPPMPSRCAS